MAGTVERTKALEILSAGAERIGRNIMEVALASGIDPEDMKEEISTDKNILSVSDYLSMQNKLKSWVEREILKITNLKTAIENMPIPQEIK